MTTLPLSHIFKKQTPDLTGVFAQTGAGNETRTRDLNLGKVALYQLSYSRPNPTGNCRAVPWGVKKCLNYRAIPAKPTADTKS